MGTNTQQDVTLRFTLNQADYERVKAGLEGLQRGVGTLRNAMGTLGVSLPSIALVGFTKNAADAASQQRALAESLGLSVERFSTLNYIARQSETTQEDLGKALFKVSQLLKDGAESGSQASKLLAQFGITSEKIRNGSIDTNRALELIADRFAEMPAGIDKAALASELLGDKLGQRLIPFLNNGSKGFEELAKQGAAAGAILTDRVADAVAKANDKLDAMYQTLQTRTLVGLAALFGLIEANDGDEAIQDLTDQITGLQGRLVLLSQFKNEPETGGIAGALIHAGDAAEIASINNRLTELLKARQKLIDQQMKGFEKPKSALVAPVAPKAADPAALAKDALEAQKLADKESAAVTDAELARIAKETEARKRLLQTYAPQSTALAQIRADQEALRQEVLAGNISWDHYSEAIAGLEQDLIAIGDAIPEVTEATNEASDAMDEFARQAAHNMQDVVASFLRGETAGKNFVSSLLQSFAQLASEIAAQAFLKQMFGSLASSSNSTLSSIGVAFGGAKPVKNADGGYISGAGGPTDDKVPALLSNGEFVIRAAAVSRLGRAFLENLNAMGTHGPMVSRGYQMFSDGGLVRAMNISPAKPPVIINVAGDNIDARNATPEMLPVLQAMMDRGQAETIKKIRELTSRDRLLG